MQDILMTTLYVSLTYISLQDGDEKSGLVSLGMMCTKQTLPFLSGTDTLMPVKVEMKEGTDGDYEL